MAVPGAIENCTSMGELMGAKFHSKMAVCDGEVTPARERVAGDVLHLAQGVDRIGAHGDGGAGGAVVQVQVIVRRPLAAIDQQSRAGC